MIPANPLLVVLPGPSAEEAVRLAEKLAPHVGGFVAGPDLLMGPGPGVVGALARLGPVFADAKLHDVPSTAHRAAVRLAGYGARWVSAHAAGGAQMLDAVVAGVREGSGGFGGVMAITVLTSLDPAGLAAAGLGNSPGRLVARFARSAADAGAEGVVCSVKELGDVAQTAPGLVKAVAGIRSAGEASDDHLRAASMEEALERGADLVIVGRPITAAGDPAGAAATVAAGLAGNDNR